MIFFNDFLGKIKWIREESLADLAVVEMVDLPLADSEGAIEKQLKSNNGKLQFWNPTVEYLEDMYFLQGNGIYCLSRNSPSLSLNI